MTDLEKKLRDKIIERERRTNIPGTLESEIANSIPGTVGFEKDGYNSIAGTLAAERDFQISDSERESEIFHGVNDINHSEKCIKENIKSKDDTFEEDFFPKRF